MEGQSGLLELSVILWVSTIQAGVRGSTVLEKQGLYFAVASINDSYCFVS